MKKSGNVSQTEDCISHERYLPRIVKILMLVHVFVSEASERNMKHIFNAVFHFTVKNK